IQRPSEDRFLMTKEDLEDKMAVLLGGRAAEHIVFGHLSTGAADDLAKVTEIARDMVMRYGMEDKVGPVSYESPRPPFLAGPPSPAGAPPDGWHERRYSEDTANAIDQAVREIVKRLFDRAVALLRERRAILERSAKLLLEKETLDEADLAAIRAEVRAPEPTR